MMHTSKTTYVATVPGSGLGRILTIAAVWAGLSACGAREENLGTLQIQGATSSRSGLFMKLADTPENAAQANEYRVWIASGSDLAPATVRLCLGDIAACRLPGATYITTKAVPNNGKVTYVTDQPVALRENLILTAVAQTVTGGAILQKTVKVSAVGTLTVPSQPVVPPQGGTDCYKGEPLICEAEKLIVEYTNAYRQQSGRPALKHHANLAFVSRDWSEKMAKQYGMGHTGFSQGWRNTVYKAEFGGMGSMRISSENVAMSGFGLNSAQGIARHFTDMWWKSPGHKQNMLGGHAVLGAGLYKKGGSWYATQLFGRE